MRSPPERKETLARENTEAGDADDLGVGQAGRRGLRPGERGHRPFLPISPRKLSAKAPRRGFAISHGATFVESRHRSVFVA